MRRHLALALVAVLAGGTIAGGAVAAVKAKAAGGTVNANFTITSTLRNKTVKKGVYVFTIRDRTGDHNYHLKGPGVNKATSVGGTGTFVWKVTLRPGTYTFQCDPHSGSMRGTFRVTN